MAQEYANYLAKIKRLVHSQNKFKNEIIGENLAFAFDTTKDFYTGRFLIKKYEHFKEFK